MERPRLYGSLLAGAALAGSLLWGSNAWASSTGGFIDKIPSSNVFSCINCHLDMLGTGLTSFGEDVKPLLNGPADAGGTFTWTKALCQEDSDGDGQTNGQELGDPCCTWVEGVAEPRTTAISNPGDATSRSTDPTTPVCASPSSDDGGGGGCALVGSAVGLSGSAVALVVMALAAGGPLRRRRR
jgi:hypothetical protein